VVWLSKPGGVLRERWFLIMYVSAFDLWQGWLGFAVYNVP
jgi:hypothetical protein